MKYLSKENYLYSAGVLLAATAIAKFVSAGGSAGILRQSDPILGVKFQHVFMFVGAMEIVVALFCFFSKRMTTKASLVAWLSTSFLVYRVGLLLVGYKKPCSCLGNLTDALHIPPEIAAIGMRVVLAYLLFGSYFVLFSLWRQKHEFAAPLPPRETPASSVRFTS